RLCHLKRPREESRVADTLRVARDGLARERATLGTIRDCLLVIGRSGDAARSFGSHNRQLRLRCRADTGLARDHLSALLRRGRNLRWLRNGLDVDYPVEKVLRP